MNPLTIQILASALILLVYFVWVYRFIPRFRLWKKYRHTIKNIKMNVEADQAELDIISGLYWAGTAGYTARPTVMEHDIQTLIQSVEVRLTAFKEFWVPALEKHPRYQKWTTQFSGPPQSFEDRIEKKFWNSFANPFLTTFFDRLPRRYYKLPWANLEKITQIYMDGITLWNQQQLLLELILPAQEKADFYARVEEPKLKAKIQAEQRDIARLDFVEAQTTLDFALVVAEELNKRDVFTAGIPALSFEKATAIWEQKREEIVGEEAEDEIIEAAETQKRIGKLIALAGLIAEYPEWAADLSPLYDAFEELEEKYTHMLTIGTPQVPADELQLTRDSLLSQLPTLWMNGEWDTLFRKIEEENMRIMTWHSVLDHEYKVKTGQSYFQFTQSGDILKKSAHPEEIHNPTPAAATPSNGSAPAGSANGSGHRIFDDLFPAQKKVTEEA